MLAKRIIFINNFIKTFNLIGKSEPSIHDNAQFFFLITLILILFVIIDVRNFSAFCINGKDPNVDQCLRKVKVNTLENRMMQANVLNQLFWKNLFVWVLNLLLNARWLILFLGPLVRSIHRVILTCLLWDWVFVIQWCLKSHPLMNEIFKFLLILEFFLFWAFDFGRNVLFMGEKVIKFTLLRLEFRVNQFALGMMKRELHKIKIGNFTIKRPILIFQ
jgi:hypothetical protein